MKMKPKFHYIRRAVLHLNRCKASNDLKEITEEVNAIVDIHKECIAVIKELEDNKAWNILQDGPYYETLSNTIEEIYHRATGHYRDIHWNQKGFNVYTINR